MKLTGMPLSWPLAWPFALGALCLGSCPDSAADSTPAPGTSTQASFALTLQEAESRALAASNRLKAAGSDEEASQQEAHAQFEQLLPRLSLQANYQYFNEIPQVRLGAFPPLAFGTNSVYSFGPALTYTLFDGFSAHKSYTAISLLKNAREEDRKATALQLMLSTRSAYVQVQLGIEELALIQQSQGLAQAQHHDVQSRFRAGAATRLELVTAERSVLSYQIQFKQRQAELASALRDLLAILQGTEPAEAEIEQPGPEGIPDVKLVLKLDPLVQTLSDQSKISLEAPTDQQPLIQSQLIQANSLRLNAESQSGHAYPILQVGAAVNYNRPDMPNPPNYWQESVSAALTLPLYLGDSSRDLAAQFKAQADSADYRAAQAREDVHRDYSKAQEMLTNLREQQKLAATDVDQSELEARLYYTSYKAGKINFIDVQNANVQALQAKVNAARINAQIVSQIILLRSLSGKGDRS